MAGPSAVAEALYDRRRPVRAEEALFGLAGQRQTSADAGSLFHGRCNLLVVRARGLLPSTVNGRVLLEIDLGPERERIDAILALVGGRGRSDRKHAGDDRRTSHRDRGT